MNDDNVLKDIATMILKQSHEMGIEHGELADKANVSLAALSNMMTMADLKTEKEGSHLPTVMRVLDVLKLEMIVIPKED